MKLKSALFTERLKRGKLFGKKKYIIKDNDSRITQVCQWEGKQKAKTESGLKITQFKLEIFKPSKLFTHPVSWVFMFYRFPSRLFLSPHPLAAHVR